MISGKLILLINRPVSFHVAWHVSCCVQPCLPSSWLQPHFVHLHLHSPAQSDIKPDDLLLKGSKTKEKSKEKKSSKDKKKSQAADGAEKQPVKAKVDELMVNIGNIRTLTEN